MPVVIARRQLPNLFMSWMPRLVVGSAFSLFGYNARPAPRHDYDISVWTGYNVPSAGWALAVPEIERLEFGRNLPLAALLTNVRKSLYDSRHVPVRIAGKAPASLWVGAGADRETVSTQVAPDHAFKHPVTFAESIPKNKRETKFGTLAVQTFSAWQLTDVIPRPKKTMSLPAVLVLVSCQDLDRQDIRRAAMALHSESIFITRVHFVKLEDRVLADNLVCSEIVAAVRDEIRFADDVRVLHPSRVQEGESSREEVALWSKVDGARAFAVGRGFAEGAGLYQGMYILDTPNGLLDFETRCVVVK
jgi:hypothetical protein